MQDHRCQSHPTHVDEKVLCRDCEVPFCNQCREHLSKGKLPPLSYANDMWTGYGLELIYQKEVTAMELLCASPCLTSMILMSMEARHNNAPEAPAKGAATPAFDEKAHMARHRFGARGNLITFPLPIEDMVAALQEHNAPEDLSDPGYIPRSGAALGDFVRVILKTNKEGQTTDAEIKTLIHQATVRRQAQGSIAVVQFQKKKGKSKSLSIRIA